MSKLWIVAVFALTVLAEPILAQFPPPGGPPAGRPGMPGMSEPPRLLVLAQKSVQDDLHLDRSQVQKVNEAVTRFQNDFRTAARGTAPNDMPARLADLDKQSDKIVDDLLNTMQTSRLRQIMLQSQGGRALLNPEVADKLGLTDEQKKKLDTIQEKDHRQVQALMQSGPSGMQQMEQLRKSTSKKMLDVLTSEQKTTWKELTGPTFKGTLSFGPPGRP